MKETLAVLLFILAAFFATGGAWFTCALLAVEKRDLRVPFAVLLAIAVAVVAVLAAAGWELA